MTGTNNVSTIAGEAVKGIPEKIEFYGKMLTIVEQNLFTFLEGFGLDPAHFLFCALIFLFVVLAALSKWKIGRWVLLGVVIVMCIALIF